MIRQRRNRITSGRLGGTRVTVREMQLDQHQARLSLSRVEPNCLRQQINHFAFRSALCGFQPRQFQQRLKVVGIDLQNRLEPSTSRADVFFPDVQGCQSFNGRHKNRVNRQRCFITLSSARKIIPKHVNLRPKVMRQRILGKFLLQGVQRLQRRIEILLQQLHAGQCEVRTCAFVCLSDLLQRSDGARVARPFLIGECELHRIGWIGGIQRGGRRKAAPRSLQVPKRQVGFAGQCVRRRHVAGGNEGLKRGHGLRRLTHADLGLRQQQPNRQAVRLHRQRLAERALGLQQRTIGQLN
mmetsp:Transcript_39182/g.92012  ORF Transcript_39182/g.92012 Transcript_39182/m.92012 type:complete len:297 (-) Transcript_39182:5821-6711(-)